MERQVRPLVRLSASLLFILAAVLAPLPAAADPTPSPSAGPGKSITISLPAGVSLNPGTYDVVIRGLGGEEIRTKVVVAAAPARQGDGGSRSPAAGQPGSPAAGQPGPATAKPHAGQTPAVSSKADSTLPIAVLVVVLLALAGFLLYTRVLTPRRKIRSYRQALALLSAGEYRQALPELSRLESSLPPKRRADARFFIAFALYQLDDLDEAEHRLAALNREDRSDVHVAYLLAYIRVARRDFDRAEAVLESIESSGQLGTGQCRKLYGVVKFHRALQAFTEGRIDAAAELFEKAEQLGDFHEHIPADLRNRHVVLGAQALFEKDVRQARMQFEALEQAAQRLDAAQHDSMLASAKLGLALTAWIEDAPGSSAKLEDLLVEAAKLLDPHGDLTQPWGEDTGGADVVSLLAALENSEGRSREQHGLDRALRDIHFLRGIAVLRSWANADRAAASDSAETYLGDALARFACARDRDQDFSDVYLVVGLLRYYLAATDLDRAAGAALLREAQKLGMRDPEALQIVNHHDRIRQANRDAVDAYLHVLDRYLLDGTVREQVRAALVRRLSRYGKVRDWDRRPELTRVHAVQPTVAEMNERSQLLMERVSQLMATQPGTADLAAARDLTRSLEHESRVLSEHARSVEQKEAELLVLVGDRLLADSER
jgi:hypothetical protein